MEERIERESDMRREEKWQTCWCCRDQQKAYRMAQASAEKLEHTGPAEMERVASVPQREQLARTSQPPLPKEKSRLSKAPDHEGVENQGGQELHLGEKQGDQSESMERKGWTRPRRKADSKEEREGKQEEPP